MKKILPGFALLAIGLWLMAPAKTLAQADIITDEYLQQFSEMAKQTAQKYGSSVAAYEIWNEEDQHSPNSIYLDPVAYAKLLSAAYSSIKSVGGSNVIVGGLVSGNTGYLSSVIQAQGGSLQADGVGVHPYILDVSSIRPSLDNYLGASQGKPLWVTEYGWETADQQAQANYLVDAFNIFQSYGGQIQSKVWYCWSDAMNSGFGIVDSSGNPKQAYYQFPRGNGLQIDPLVTIPSISQLSGLGVGWIRIVYKPISTINFDSLIQQYSSAGIGVILILNQETLWPAGVPGGSGTKPKTSLNSCSMINEKGGYEAEQSSPLLIKEKVTYSSNEGESEPNLPDTEAGGCFPVTWKAKLDLEEETFQLPMAYGLNEYFLGAIDIHKNPPETLDPLQLAIRRTLEDFGPSYKLTPETVQDRLKNQFLEEVLDRINNGLKTAYLADSGQIYMIGPWTLKEIYESHNVYQIKQADPQAEIDQMTGAVWALVPLFANETTEGNISFSAADMRFTPNPIKTKVPEVYRLNKITNFLQDLFLPNLTTPTPNLQPNAGPVIAGAKTNLLAQAPSGEVPPCCFYYFPDSYGDCSCMNVIKENGDYSCRGESSGCCGMHLFWGVCGYKDCNCEARGCTNPPNHCDTDYWGGPPLPTPPPRCDTQTLPALYPNPEAVADTENSTPNLCLIDKESLIDGRRSVKNKCPYDQNGDPQECTTEFTSPINIVNNTPWLESIRAQTIDINTGFLRSFQPWIGTEDDPNNPFRPLPAKDPVTYTYQHLQTLSGNIQTSIQIDNWELDFANLGGVWNAKNWVARELLAPAQ